MLFELPEGYFFFFFLISVYNYQYTPLEDLAPCLLLSRWWDSMVHLKFTDVADEVHQRKRLPPHWPIMGWDYHSVTVILKAIAVPSYFPHAWSLLKNKRKSSFDFVLSILNNRVVGNCCLQPAFFPPSKQLVLLFFRVYAETDSFMVWTPWNDSFQPIVNYSGSVKNHRK